MTTTTPTPGGYYRIDGLAGARNVNMVFTGTRGHGHRWVFTQWHPGTTQTTEHPIPAADCTLDGRTVRVATPLARGTTYTLTGARFPRGVDARFVDQAAGTWVFTTRPAGRTIYVASAGARVNGRRVHVTA